MLIKVILYVESKLEGYDDIPLDFVVRYLASVLVSKILREPGKCISLKVEAVDEDR